MITILIKPRDMIPRYRFRPLLPYRAGTEDGKLETKNTLPTASPPDRFDALAIRADLTLRTVVVRWTDADAAAPPTGKRKTRGSPHSDVGTE